MSISKVFCFIVVLAFIGTLAACGGGQPAATEAPAEQPAATVGAPEQPAASEAPAEAAATGYSEMEVTDGGSVSGHVVWDGAAPEPEVVSVAADMTEEQQVCGSEITVLPAMVAADGSVGGAVAYLKGITAGKAMSEMAASPELDQVQCQYTPSVALAPVGASISIVNSDPFAHNVNVQAFDNDPLNSLQPAGSAPLAYMLTAPEAIQVGCDIHKWMSAWLLGVDNPYYVVTGADGSFNLGDVPAGEYELVIWQGGAEKTTVPVTVTAGQDSAVGDIKISGS